MAYPLRRLLWRLRTPMGHKLSSVVPFRSGAARYWLAHCECEWTERAMSEAAARGALRGHQRSARPWERYDPEGPDTDAAALDELAELPQAPPPPEGRESKGTS